MSLGNPSGQWVPESFQHKRPSHVYVVGFAFSRQMVKGAYIPSSDPVFGYPHNFDAMEVLLEIKARPEWQQGRLNGIGGKVEAGEWPADAMYREFEEETGLALEGWKLFCLSHGATPSDEYSVVYFYWTWGERSELEAAVARTAEGDEPLALMNMRDVRADDRAIIHNLRWLTQMARNHIVGAEYAKYFEVFERYDSDPPVTGHIHDEYKNAPSVIWPGARRK